MKIQRICFFVILSFFMCYSLSSNVLYGQSTIPITALQGLKYRLAGPSRGGRATAVAGIREQPFTFFMGSTGGGIWKTDDAGLNWKNVSDGYFKSGSIGAIEVAPSDPNIIYVGTGSASPRGKRFDGRRHVQEYQQGTNLATHWSPEGRIGRSNCRSSPECGPGVCGGFGAIIRSQPRTRRLPLGEWRD